MDLNHLQIFCAVVEAGSISKAARNLYLTQPAISLKIQELENHYQVQLLERTNKGVVPTEIGQYLYEEGTRILAMLDNLGKRIEQAKNPVHEIKLGASSTVGSYALPYTIFLFKERYPNHKVILQICNSAEVVEKMVTRTVEMGIIEGPLTPDLKETLVREGIFTRWLMRDQLYLIVPNNEAYRNTENASLDELKEMPLIIREEGSGIRTTVEQTIRKQGLQLAEIKVVQELNTTNAILSAVASGIGVTLLPKMVVSKELRLGYLKSISLNGLLFEHDYTLLYYPQTMKKKAYNAFYKLLSSKERGFA